MPGVRIRSSYALAAVGVLAAAWLGPLPELGSVSFAARTALHVAVVCAAAPLAALAVARSRFDPVKRWPYGFSPLAAAFVELLVAWGWQMPAPALAVGGSIAAFAAAQASFLGAGVLLWLSVLGGDDDARYERAGVGVIALLLTSMHMTVLGVLSMISAPPLFGRIGELAASLDDQRLGGLLMLAGAAIVYVAAGVLLLARLLRPASVHGEGAA